MGLLKKLTKPLSKVLDKIVPNEIKPALPYLAAFAPFMLGPGAAAGSWWQKALYNPALRAGIMGGTNIASQLAQEGSEGEFSGLSALLAAGTGYGTAGGAQEALGSMRFGDPTLAGPEYWKTPMEELSFVEKMANKGITGLQGASKFLTEAGETISDPNKWRLDTETLAAFGTPITHGTADLAMADARRALRDYENEMAADEATSLIDDDGRRRAIRAAMEAAGHLEDTILDALGSLGLKEGGIVGLKKGGRIGYWKGGAGDYMDLLEKELAKEFPDQELIQQLKALINEQFSIPDKAKGGRISKEGGGIAGVLPKGKEADYRGGGVIPIGSRERADDVPARLSKNEFVMTADAVRAAGGGNINQGAKRMYNLMNNLEARV
jgi:hypothetical protein